MRHAESYFIRCYRYVHKSTLRDEEIWQIILDLAYSLPTWYDFHREVGCSLFSYSDFKYITDIRWNDNYEY